MLDFESRQRQWAGEKREFRQHHGRQDRPHVWEIRVDGDRVFTRHGLLGGAMQDTSYVGKYKNKGKKNEITPEQDALAEARRDCRKKWDFEGYDEYINEENIDRRFQNISIASLLTNLPGSFCLYKPENNLYDQKKLLAKAEAGDAFYTLKRDGMAHWVIKDYYGNIQIYSRRSRAWSDSEEPVELPDGTLDYSKVRVWSERYPHLVEAVQNLNLPNLSMMAVELVAPKEDNFKYISGLTKGYTDRAIEDMKKGGLPHFYWWDVPFYAGEDLLASSSFRRRYEIIRWHTSAIQMQSFTESPIKQIEILKFSSPEEAIIKAKDLGFEGFVVIDPDAIYGDKGWNLKGKPDRPSSVAKLKPWFEDDFIAIWDPDNNPKGKKVYGEWGTGKHEANKIVELPNGETVTHGGVGSIGLWQYNSKGELVFISKCSSGMSYEFQAKLRKEHFPFVVEVQYAERTYMSDGEDTNALKFPQFVRVRTDKTIKECINDRL